MQPRNKSEAKKKEANPTLPDTSVRARVRADCVYPIRLSVWRSSAVSGDTAAHLNTRNTKLMECVCACVCGY